QIPPDSEALHLKQVFSSSVPQQSSKDLSSNHKSLSASSSFRHPLQEEKSTSIDVLAVRVAEMQKQVCQLWLEDSVLTRSLTHSQIDTLVKATASSSSSSSSHVPTASKSHPPDNRLDSVWKELRDLRSLITSTHSTVPPPPPHSSLASSTGISSTLKSYIKKEIKKHDQVILDDIVRPEISKELARMDVRWNQKLERIRTSSTFDAHPPTLSTAIDTSDITASTTTDDSSILYAPAATSTQSTPKRHTHSSTLQHPTYTASSSAEEELHDLMTRLKADLDKRTGQHPPIPTFISKTPPSSASKKRGGTQAASYSQPTFASRLKTRNPVWK
ncbi:hypothetical protein BCR33DRAFT_719688, partial [Rhizoclosmatium globosum]